MQWCGMIHEPGINYKQCPYECAKQKAFWGAAAKKVKIRKAVNHKRHSKFCSLLKFHFKSPLISDLLQLVKAQPPAMLLYG